jgi:anti-anti-sigma regulatory factor
MSDSPGESAEQPILVLPAILDLKAAPDLKRDLEAARETGNPLQVDAGQVQRVSSLCLQLLAAARQDRAAETGLEIFAASQVFHEAASGLGLGQALGLAGDRHA